MLCQKEDAEYNSELQEPQDSSHGESALRSETIDAESQALESELNLTAVRDDNTEIRFANNCHERISKQLPSGV